MGWLEEFFTFLCNRAIHATIGQGLGASRRLPRDMNEIGLIAGQLATERAHLRAVANAYMGALERATQGSPTGGAPFAEFRQACVDYLVRVLTAFEERDQRLNDLLQTKFAKDDSTRRALLEALARRGRSREALEKLEAAVAAATAKGRSVGNARAAFTEFFNQVWVARREAIDTLFAANSRTTAWRAIGGIDADSILGERRAYARVRAALPAGVVLESSPGS